MANPEHVAKLKEGIESWINWRAENPGFRPDLSEAPLSFADLSGADLSAAQLSKADLFGTKLIEANLKRPTCGTNCALTGKSPIGLVAGGWLKYWRR